MQNHFKDIFSILLSPEKRLPAIEDWLRNHVWSVERFVGMEPQEYLESGEKLLRQAEDLILTGAPQLYDEMLAASESTTSLLGAFGKGKTAVVVFDGASIRELPLFLALAKATGFLVNEARYSIAALPSDTLAFVEQRLLARRIGPSQLEGRKELKNVGIAVRYYDTTIRVFELHNLSNSLLLWSSFPDGTYMNFEARSSGHFESLVKQFDVVWKNVILSIPPGYRIIITSDHGYAYLNVGFESEFKADQALEILENNRYRLFVNSEDLPENISELQLIPHRRTAMLRGRVKNRPQGPSANKVFRHGDMSLMEMLTPYVVLEQSPMKV